jgi:hypothetical protein
MTSNVVRVFAPNGEEYLVDIASLEDPKTIKKQLISGGRMARWFTIAEKGYHEFTRKHLVASAKDGGKVTVYGRDCLILTGSDGSVATFIGQYHDLQTAFGGPTPTTATVSQIFNGLTINDTPSRMTIGPKTATLLNNTTFAMLVRVPNRGHIHLLSPEQARSIVPVHAGVRTSSGELWRQPLDTENRPAGVRGHSYVVGSKTGAGYVFINPFTTATDDELLEWLDGIKITVPGY